jgi:hypothetical protein
VAARDLRRSYFFFRLPLRSGACVKAEPATDLARFEDFGLRSCLAAAEATRFEVFSQLATLFLLRRLPAAARTQSLIQVPPSPRQ